MIAPEYRAWNKGSLEMERVLLICFVNRYVDVLPDRNLEGGNQESWKFQNIELMKLTIYTDMMGKRMFEGDVIKYDEFARLNPRKDLVMEVRIPDIYLMRSGMVNIRNIGNKYNNPELLKSE